jgi:hypothetical protein
MKKATKELIESKPRFGKLVLTGNIMQNEVNKGRNSYKVEAICDCGSIKYYYLHNLKSNSHRRNCGCMRHSQGGTTVAKALLKDIRRFCKATKMAFDEKLMTINKRRIYVTDTRFYYLDNRADVIKDYYQNNGESTNYGVSSYVNHYKFRG